MSTYSLLVADATVQAITTKIYIGQAPQKTTGSYVVLDYVSVNPVNHITEVSTTDNSRIGIECIGTTQQISIALYKACRAALENDGLVLIIPIYGELDSKSMLYRTLFDYSFWGTR
jgi:uncharacterized phage protein gp47/JayE